MCVCVFLNGAGPRDGGGWVDSGEYEAKGVTTHPFCLFLCLFVLNFGDTKKNEDDEGIRKTDK